MKRRTAFVLSGIGLAVAACFTGVYRFLRQPKFGALPTSLEILKTALIFMTAFFTILCQHPF